MSNARSWLAGLLIVITHGAIAADLEGRVIAVAGTVIAAEALPTSGPGPA